MHSVRAKNAGAVGAFPEIGSGIGEHRAAPNKAFSSYTAQWDQEAISFAMTTDARPPETVALLALGRWLRARAYRFTTVTPATHARINDRAGSAQAADLRDVFGWSRPFARDLLDPQALHWLHHADLLGETRHGLLRSKVRFSSLGDCLFAHSAYPTADADAVFFGPDTVRFVALIAAELARLPLPHAARILDMGCGGGPGGIVTAQLTSASEPRLVLADINARALHFARANAALAGVAPTGFEQGDLFAAVSGSFDLIVANPPYLNDSAKRIYRHGGGEWGGGLSERIVHEGLPCLSPGGRLVLYTGTAIVRGEDPLLRALAPHLTGRGWPWRYREIDPDVFGEELDEPAYAGAERIAAVSLVVQRPAP
jgi:SAM-dependent methyltransferase